MIIASCFRERERESTRERKRERSKFKGNRSVDNFLQLSQICIQEENYSQVPEIFIKQVIIRLCAEIYHTAIKKRGRKRGREGRREGGTSLGC